MCEFFTASTWFIVLAAFVWTILFLTKLIIFIYFKISYEELKNATWHRTPDTANIRRKIFRLATPVWVGFLLLMSKVIIKDMGIY
jgi:hypothetical protein